MQEILWREIVMFEIIPNWHPIFVHFTVALIPLSTLCYFMGFIIKPYKLGGELLVVARWCLWFAALSAIATVIAGFYAYYTVAHDTPSHIAMTVHRNWAISTLIAILLMAAWSLYKFVKNKSIGVFFIGFMVIATTLVTVTAWHGAEVVYRYGVGVKSLPKSIDSGHDHSHVH